jgi:hypothetical protein
MLLGKLKATMRATPDHVDVYSLYQLSIIEKAIDEIECDVDDMHME